jgi:ABC-type multidrug transport system ATPase subunit
MQPWRGSSRYTSNVILRPIPLLVLAAWLAAMGAVVKRAYIDQTPGTLAADLSHYGSSAQWRGIYYRGEKIGFSVSQADALEIFELTRWEHELVESFSHGMKQRLVMCAAFLHRPKAVLVDEPMVGLDPRGARLIKAVFRRMAASGVALLMSTHTLEVAQEMCDRISIILKGRIIANGTVEDLRALAGGQDEALTAVFLKLTGGTGLQEIDEIV